MMTNAEVRLGNDRRTVQVSKGALIEEVVAKSGLTVERQCAGKGTCGKCRVIASGSLSPLSTAEMEKLSTEQLKAGYRLACQARVTGDSSIALFPTVVYSNKTFQVGGRDVKFDEDLGLAVDLGTTTVAAFLTSLRDGTVFSGSAVLNQQTMYGADVISRLQVADEEKDQLSRLALLSICDALRGLKLDQETVGRVRKAVITGNTAMHHLLLRLPVGTLRVMPFQPATTSAFEDHSGLLKNCLPAVRSTFLPPLIGGFVGSDTLACMVYFGFDKTDKPMLSIDLGTNGEVMLTDGKNLLVTSTAAGPAFEGVNISCGTRAVDGAVVGVELEGGQVSVQTIGDKQAIGIAGSGLLNLVRRLREAGVIDVGGKLIESHPEYSHLISSDSVGKRFMVTDTVYLTQRDIRELQNAKAAIRSATEILLSHLEVKPADLSRVILTGAFGSKVDVDDVLGLGMLPAVNSSVIEAVPNGAGLGAAMFFEENAKQRGIDIAERTEHVELNMEPDFMDRFVSAMMM